MPKTQSKVLSVKPACNVTHAPVEQRRKQLLVEKICQLLRGHTVHEAGIILMLAQQKIVERATVR